MIDLKEIDKTIELWNSIPNIPNTEIVLDEEHIEWSGDDWTVSSACTRPEFYFCGRFDLWNGFESSGKPIVRPKISHYFKGGKNEKC